MRLFKPSIVASPGYEAGLIEIKAGPTLFMCFARSPVIAGRIILSESMFSIPNNKGALPRTPVPEVVSPLWISQKGIRRDGIPVIASVAKQSLLLVSVSGMAAS